MALVHMDINTVVIAGGPIASLVVLQPKSDVTAYKARLLPIRIGRVEASQISMGARSHTSDRPMTHDVFFSTIEALGAHVVSVAITEVHATTFYAQINLVDSKNAHLSIDARPSDAIALAVRAEVPIFVEEDVLEAGSLPSFNLHDLDISEDSFEDFHEFVEKLTPEDFS